MRIVVALVAVLYGLAAIYGYFWWSERYHDSETLSAQAASTAMTSIKLSRESLQLSDSKSADNMQLVTQQLQSLQATVEVRLKQMELQQALTLNKLQQQLDELKQQQTLNLAHTKAASASVPSPNLNQTTSTTTEPPPTEQVLESQTQQAKLSLKTQIGQFDLRLQTELPNIARQSVLQQTVDNALNQAELGNLIQTHAECGQALCKLDIQGQTSADVDVLQALWERKVFPEETVVMSIPKPDGSGWFVYINETSPAH